MGNGALEYELDERNEEWPLAMIIFVFFVYFVVSELCKRKESEAGFSSRPVNSKSTLRSNDSGGQGSFKGQAHRSRGCPVMVARLADFWAEDLADDHREALYVVLSLLVDEYMDAPEEDECSLFASFSGQPI